MILDLNNIQNNAVVKLARYCFFALIITLTIAALFEYKGHLYIYLLFSVVSNLLLYFGVRKKAIFFDTFIGVFFWLGFWLKLTLRICFTEGLFHEAVGGFDGSGAAFDRSLLVASCGLAGLLVASIIREKFVFSYPEKFNNTKLRGLFEFYKDHRKALLSVFVALFVTVAVTNVYFGIYQKGTITQTILPFGFNGIYKWLLLFGLASFSAVILRFEFEINKSISYMVVILSLIEGFFSNVSLLSRGMILNSGALLYGVFISLKLNALKISLRFFITIFMLFTLLFVSSVFMVNSIRGGAFQALLGYKELSLEALDLEGAQNMAAPLFIDRWVGIEGVMAVSSYPNLGWNFWDTAWQETYNENATSFYDMTLIESPYINTDKTKHHHISLPGIVAFFFYPGSFMFLFASMFMLGIIAASIERLVFNLGGENVILCSLLAQVVAYRFASFGYVPIQTYLLIGALFLNLFIIYFTDKFLLLWRNKSLETRV
jgi:hypothetical protein